MNILLNFNIEIPKKYNFLLDIKVEQKSQEMMKKLDF